MSSRDHRHEDEPSFEDVVDLGSVPPPPPASGPVDVHRAPTAVAVMTDELMDEIRRARQDAKSVESRRAILQQHVADPEDGRATFDDETPTRPGKDQGRGLLAPSEPPASSRPPISVEPRSRPSRSPIPFARSPWPGAATSLPPLAPPVRRRRVWLQVVLVIVTLAALAVSGFALGRYRNRSGPLGPGGL